MGSNSQNIFSKKLSLQIPFVNHQTAILAYDVLSIDKDLKGNRLKRVMHADGNNLSVEFYSSDLKLMRVAVNSFLKNIILVVKSIQLQEGYVKEDARTHTSANTS